MSTGVITTLSNQQLSRDDVEEQKAWMSLVRDKDEGLDNCAAWVVCFCCSLASMINLGSSYCYGLFFPAILAEFQAGKAATALAGSVTVAMSSLLAPVVSKLCDRYGCRLVMIGGGFMAAVAQLGSSFAPNVYVLQFSYGVGFGIASCLVFMSAIQIVPLYFNRNWSLGLAIVNSGSAGGLLLMTLFIPKLLEHFDWRRVMMILAAMNVMPCFLGCTINRKKKLSEKTTEERQNKPFKKHTKILKASLVVNPQLMLLCLTIFIACIGYTMPSIHLAKYAEDLGIPISRSSWMYLSWAISSLMSRLLTGRICDNGWISHIRIFQFTIGLLGIVDFSLPLTTSFTLLMGLSVTYGICEGAIMTAMHSYVLITFAGNGFGWYCTFMGFGFLIGPVLAGVIADVSGSYHPAFITAGILLFISAFLPFFMRYLQKPNKPEEVSVNDYLTEELVIFEKMTVL